MFSYPRKGRDFLKQSGELVRLFIDPAPRIFSSPAKLPMLEGLEGEADGKPPLASERWFVDIA